MRKYENSFYDWVEELNEKKEEIEALIKNEDGLNNISYEYRGQKTNVINSGVERAAIGLEELKKKLWDIIYTKLLITRALYGVPINNLLGYQVINGKLNGEPREKIKKYGSAKAIKEAEENGIEYIKRYLNKHNVRYNF